MQHLEMNLNIWSYLPDKYYSELPSIFSQMDGWLGSGGYGNDSGFWYSYKIDGNQKFICCHLEPSGLHFNAYMDINEWNEWKRKIKSIATKTLGFKVGEPELGDCDFNFGHEYAERQKQ